MNSWARVFHSIVWEAAVSLARQKFLSLFPAALIAIRPVEWILVFVFNKIAAALWAVVKEFIDFQQIRFTDRRLEDAYIRAGVELIEAEEMGEAEYEIARAKHLKAFREFFSLDGSHLLRSPGA